MRGSTRRAGPALAVVGLVMAGPAATATAALPSHQAAALPAYQAVQRLSTPVGGVEDDGTSSDAVSSGNGRFVAFTSSSRLVEADRPGGPAEIVRVDLTTGQREIVSRSSTGQRGNGTSVTPVLSGDGSVVAYRSRAGNLVPGDTNGTWDVFVTDIPRGTTERVSVSSAGGQINGDVYGATLEDLSPDGRFVTFSSSLPQLVPGDSNRTDDVFVHDRSTRTTTRVSVGDQEQQGAGYAIGSAITGDGHEVLFCSSADRLVAGDRNGGVDLFLRDLVAGTTARISRQPFVGGAECLPTITPDGRFVAHGVPPRDPDGDEALTRVLDRASGTASVLPLSGRSPVGLTADGRYAVGRRADGLGSQLTMVERSTGASVDLDVTADGTPADNQTQFSHPHGLSATGRTVAFASFGRLTPGDTGDKDVFVRRQR